MEVDGIPKQGPHASGRASCPSPAQLRGGGGNEGAAFLKTLQQMCRRAHFLNWIHTYWSFTEEQSPGNSFMLTFYGGKRSQRDIWAPKTVLRVLLQMDEVFVEAESLEMEEA